jgi:hypothetical protein
MRKPLEVRGGVGQLMSNPLWYDGGVNEENEEGRMKKPALLRRGEALTSVAQEVVFWTWGRAVPILVRGQALAGGQPRVGRKVRSVRLCQALLDPKIGIDAKGGRLRHVTLGYA